MLKAVKEATECYLEPNVTAAQVAVPFYAGDDLKSLISSVLSAASIRTPYNSHDPAAMSAVYEHYMLARTCGTLTGRCAEHSILSAEFSNAALSAMLIKEAHSVLEDWEFLHDASLGLSQLQSEPEEQRERLERALAEVVEPAQMTFDDEDLAFINDGNASGTADDPYNTLPPRKIEGLVLLGEAANDVYLHEALSKVLGDQYERLVVANSTGSIGKVDPLYAGSTGAAFRYRDLLTRREELGLLD